MEIVNSRARIARLRLANARVRVYSAQLSLFPLGIRYLIRNEDIKVKTGDRSSSFDLPLGYCNK